MLKRYSQIILIFFKTLDLFVAGCAWAWGAVFCSLIHKWGWLDTQSPGWETVTSWMLISLVLYLFVSSRFSIYKPKRTHQISQEIAIVTRVVFMVWVFVYLAMRLGDDPGVTKTFMFSVLVSWIILAAINRLVIRLFLREFRKKGWNTRSAAIIGTGRLGQKLFHTLSRNSWTGIIPQYFISDGEVPHKKLCGLNVYGTHENVDSIIQKHGVDIVFVAVSADKRSLLTGILSKLADAPIDIRVVPDLLSTHLLRHEVSQIDELAIINMTYSPQYGWNSLLKRVFDLFVSAAAMIVLFPLIVIIAICIKLSTKGPVFYRQTRTSLGSRPFKIIKFRTMVPGAEEDTGPVWAVPRDSRVTSIGRFLRKTNLDEIPQFFNVFIGDMSLVGPRPERPELIEKFRKQIPGYVLRQQVKAGLTGWAQVHGFRGQTSLRKRVQYDLFYINNWTFGLDLRIIFMTLTRSFLDPNAY